MHLLSEDQIKCFCFCLETQRLPDTAASTLLRYWNLAASLCVNNLLHLYSAFHRRGGGGGLLKHHQCRASTWMMRRQPYCASTPPTHQLQVERRRDEASQCMGMIRRSWYQGYTSTLFRRTCGICNDHRESGPRFNISSERRCFLQYSVSVTIPWC